MVDWLHCNACYKQPGKPDGRTFLLTSCGHIYCEKCQDKGYKDKCLMCGSTSPTVVELSAKMPSQYEAHFTDPAKLMKKISHDMEEVIRIVDFQQAHKRRYAAHLLEQVTVQKQLVQQRETELKTKLSALVDEERET